MTGFTISINNGQNLDNLNNIRFALKTWVKCSVGGFCVDLIKPFKEIEDVEDYPGFIKWIDDVEKISNNILNSSGGIPPNTKKMLFENKIEMFWKGYFTEGRRLKVELNNELILLLYWDTGDGKNGSKYLKLPSKIDSNPGSWEVYPGATW